MHGRHRGDKGRYSLLLIDSREARAERNVGVLALEWGAKTLVFEERGVRLGVGERDAPGDCWCIARHLVGETPSGSTSLDLAQSPRPTSGARSRADC